MVTARRPWPSGSGASSCSRADRDGEAARRTGRDGLLVLGFERQGDRTVLAERRYALPLQALECMELEDGVAALMLLNPTGGVLGGDRLDTRVRVGAGAHACLTTPSATRVYRSVGEPARQRVVATVAAGARLEYVPDHLIPSPGSRLRQETEIVLEAGGAALVWDAWSVGRPARCEVWTFAELDLRLDVRDASGPILHERARLDGRSVWDGLGGAEGMPYLGVFVVVESGRASWDPVAEALDDALPRGRTMVRGGTAVLGRAGVLVRVAAPSAPALTETAEALWAAGRRALLDRTPLRLRKL
jgi:urease accessory protein